MSEPIRIFLVDDHEVVREGLRRMLAQCKDVCVVGDAETGERALEVLRGTECDVVLLDLNLPGAQGLDVLHELRRLPNPPGVVVLTVHDDPDLVLACLRAGALGYVLKHTSGKEIAAAIRSVAAGDCFMGADVKDIVVGAGRGSRAVPQPTEREAEVHRLMSEGLTDLERFPSLP